MADISTESIGIDIELIREALKQLGCEIIFIKSTWKRELVEFQNGRLDILSCADKKRFQMNLEKK